MIRPSRGEPAAEDPCAIPTLVAALAALAAGARTRTAVGWRTGAGSPISYLASRNWIGLRGMKSTRREGSLEDGLLERPRRSAVSRLLDVEPEGRERRRERVLRDAAERDHEQVCR
jgi:hypothetical protein